MNLDVIVKDYTKQTVQDIIQAQLEDITQQVDEAVAKQEKRLVKKMKDIGVYEIKYNEITIPDVSEQEKGILELVANNIPVYLYGKTGSGKTTLVMSLAEKLKLKIYPFQQITDESQLMGYKNVTGEYVKTNLYTAMKKGGMLYIDEIDASVPEVLITINSILANGFATFGDEVVKAHKNFRVIVSGNTFGEVSSNDSYKRATMDASSIDRFVPIEINYNTAFENELVKSNLKKNSAKAFMKTISRVRYNLDELKLGYRYPISTRRIVYYCRLFDTFTYEQFEKIVLSNIPHDIRTKLEYKYQNECLD